VWESSSKITKNTEKIKRILGKKIPQCLDKLENVKKPKKFMPKFQICFKNIQKNTVLI